MPPVRFVAVGRPRPQGSKTVFQGRAVDANGPVLRPWRQAMRTAAQQAAHDAGITVPSRGAIRVSATFTLARPASLPARPRTPEKRARSRWPLAFGTGDTDKLARALLDSMTGILYGDDAAVVALDVRKVWTGDLIALTDPGVEVHVEELDPDPQPIVTLPALRLVRS